MNKKAVPLGTKLCSDVEIEQIPNPIKIGWRHITITLSPLIYKYKARSQYKKSIDKIASLFSAFSEKAIIIPELTNKCNIHYHVVYYPENGDSIFNDFIVDRLKCDDKSPIIGLSYLNPKPVSMTRDAGVLWEYIRKEVKRTFHVINFKHIILNPFILINI